MHEHMLTHMPRTLTDCLSLFHWVPAGPPTYPSLARSILRDESDFSTNCVDSIYVIIIHVSIVDPNRKELFDITKFIITGSFPVLSVKACWKKKNNKIDVAFFVEKVHKYVHFKCVIRI